MNDDSFFSAPQLKRDPLGSDSVTTLPLVVIPEDRRQRELRRALAHAGAEHRNPSHLVGLGLVCVGWVVLGCLLVGLGFHLTDPDRAEAAFLAGILVGNGGPAWTLLISYWLDQQS